MKQLLIISDSGMYRQGDAVYAFGPVVKEVEYFLTLFDRVIWVGYDRQKKGTNRSYSKVDGSKVECILLEDVGGKNLLGKLGILFAYPAMFLRLSKLLRKTSCVHLRAPSHPAFIGMLLSFLIRKPKYWFKYAGSWVDPAPSFYNLQRRLLTKLGSHCKVTINGTWPDLPSTFYSFENPCLSEEERQRGLAVSKEKFNAKKWDVCFVGNLSPNKGIMESLEAWLRFDHSRKGVFYIIGSGSLEGSLKSLAGEDPSVEFCGTLSREGVRQHYSSCQFTLLASRTEGFPKVIGEAMNYSSIPLVTPVSCISQYIEEAKNGFIIDTLGAKEILETFERAYETSEEALDRFSKINYQKAALFQYDYYLERISNELFDLKTED